MESKPYDIVLFGATGFTGRLVARVLDERSLNAGFTFALSGRNPSKLEAVRRELRSPTIGLIAADISDHESMVTMARQGKVVLTTV